MYCKCSSLSKVLSFCKTILITQCFWQTIVSQDNLNYPGPWNSILGLLIKQINITYTFMHFIVLISLVCYWITLQILRYSICDFITSLSLLRAIGYFKDQNLLCWHQQKFKNASTIPLFLLNVVISERFMLKAPLESKIWYGLCFSTSILNFWPLAKTLILNSRDYSYLPKTILILVRESLKNQKIPRS